MYGIYTLNEQQCLPQPKIKKKRRRFSLLPNTVTNIMYSITPSHNIQQNADVKKYCRSTATVMQEIYNRMIFCINTNALLIQHVDMVLCIQYSKAVLHGQYPSKLSGASKLCSWYSYVPYDMVCSTV